MRRGLSLISSASSLNRDDLRAATRAGALCMVIRKPDWRPEDGQTLHGCHVHFKLNEEEDIKCSEPAQDQEKVQSCRTTAVEKTEARPTVYDESSMKQKEVHLIIKDPYEPPAPSGILDRLTRLLVRTDRFNNDSPSCSLVDHKSIKIHGSCRLTPGYSLAYVPPYVKVYPRQGQAIRLASTHDIPRILFSLIQTISGGYSLYKARGSQIDRYGFAAFGLTVLPYMIVSIINFVGSLLSAEYETMYMVESTSMDEMMERGGVDDGVV